MSALPDYSVHQAQGGDRGVTVFLLHGAFGAKEYWRHQVAALTAIGCRVVSWDAPGYGLSPLPADFGIGACAQALARLLAHEGGPRNLVLGHSMGGMIAQSAWPQAREHIHAYVLSATSAAFGQTGGTWQQEFVRARLAPLDAGRSIPDYAPEMLRRMMAPGASGPAVDLLIGTVSAMREDTFRAAVAAIAGYEGRHILPLIDVPVLCIAGEHDATAPAAVMEKMAAKIRGARMLTMTGAGHFGWAEQPQVFNEHLGRFMQELGWLA